MAADLMHRRAAQALDAGNASATMEAAMAKRFATDACYSVCNDALQLLGGYGLCIAPAGMHQRLRQRAECYWSKGGSGC